MLQFILADLHTVSLKEASKTLMILLGDVPTCFRFRLDNSQDGDLYDIIKSSTAVNMFSP